MTARIVDNVCVDSITRENRLNLLLAVKYKVSNQLIDIFYHQQEEFYKEVVAKENLLSELLLDNTKVIPPAILKEGRELLPSW